MPLNLMSVTPNRPTMPQFGAITLKSRAMSPKAGFYNLRVELTKDEFSRYPNLISEDTRVDAFKTEIQLDYNASYTPPFVAGEVGRQTEPTTKGQLTDLARLLMAIQPNVLLGPSDPPKPDFERQFYQGITLFMSLIAQRALAQLPDPPAKDTIPVIDATDDPKESGALVVTTPPTEQSPEPPPEEHD